MRLNQSDKGIPGNNRLHLRQELLPLGLFLGSRWLVVRETELLATNKNSPDLRSQDHSRAGSSDIKSLPGK